MGHTHHGFNHLLYFKETDLESSLKKVVISYLQKLLHIPDPFHSLVLSFLYDVSVLHVIMDPVDASVIRRLCRLLVDDYLVKKKVDECI